MEFQLPRYHLCDWCGLFWRCYLRACFFEQGKWWIYIIFACSLSERFTLLKLSLEKRRQTLITASKTIFSRETPCCNLELFQRRNRAHWVYQYNDVRRTQRRCGLLLEEAHRLMTNVTSIENGLRLHTVNFNISALTWSATFYCISSLLLKVSLTFLVSFFAFLI